MTREQELKILKEFIKDNGVTRLPPDTRTAEDFKTPTGKKARKRRTLRSVKKK